jgi:hypothetical protein
VRKGIRWLGLGIALTQDAKTVLQNATTTIGEVKSIQFSGTGHLAARWTVMGVAIAIHVTNRQGIVCRYHRSSSPSREVAARLQASA